MHTLCRVSDPLHCCSIVLTQLKLDQLRICSSCCTSFAETAWHGLMCYASLSESYAFLSTLHIEEHSGLLSHHAIPIEAILVLDRAVMTLGEGIGNPSFHKENGIDGLWQVHKV